MQTIYSKFEWPYDKLINTRITQVMHSVSEDGSIVTLVFQGPKEEMDDEEELAKIGNKWIQKEKLSGFRLQYPMEIVKISSEYLQKRNDLYTRKLHFLNPFIK